MKITRYLNEVVEKSRNKINIEFCFSDFEQINIYLIRQALNKQKHLWIKPCDNKTEQFCQPILFAVAIDFFKKNYCESRKVPHKIGDKYQQGNKRYEVIEVDFEYEYMQNPVKLKCTGNGKNKNLTRTVLSADLIDKFIKLNKNSDNTNRVTFKPMLDFVKETLNVQENIPSFPHKFAVIAQKNYFEDCFSSLDKSAFPYTYIAANGAETKNLPVSEPMFFVASNYSTIQEYIFDKDISLDTIIFMGNKYDHQLQQDVDRENFQKGIFIGEKKPDMEQLLQWCWTLPEYQYFNDLEKSQIETVKVNNATLEKETTQFIQHIEKLETDNYIDLKKLYPYVSYIYSLVVLSDNSRLKNRIDVLAQSFQRKSKQVLGEAFNSIEFDYKEANDQLVNRYQIILEQLNFQNNTKTQALQQTNETDYLLMPARQTLCVWQVEIRTLNWSKVEVISFSKFKLLERPSSVTILSLADYDFYRVIRNSRHRVKWMLYDKEYELYKKFSTRYDNELIEEYRSSDRKKLTGIDYPDATQSETINETIERIFGAESDKNEYLTTYQDHIDKRITFTTNASIELSTNSMVIYISQHDTPIKCKVTDLVVGDKIRIYENQHKEMLFDIAVEADTQGKFKEILENSELWKNKLKQYCADDKKIEEIAEKCDVANRTVDGWFGSRTDTKFPQHIERLKDIFGDDYQHIFNSKKYYNSIMIALGRDLSDEICDYIITKDKGKFLEQLDEDSIEAISEHNMPVRTIKNIEII